MFGDFSQPLRMRFYITECVDFGRVDLALKKIGGK